MRRPSRRTVLKAIATTGLAGTAGTFVAPPAATAGRNRSDYDAIVVGAGFAGVTAARELRRAGLRTLVLEARNRIGGRTWTDSFMGESIELGGSWVHETQTHIWQEISRQEVTVLADSGPDRTIFPVGDGFQFFPPEESFGHQGELVARFCQGAEEYFPRPHEPLYRADLLRSLDRLTLRDRLNQMGLSAQDESWLTGITGGLAGTSTRGALTQLGHWWALSGWNAEQYYSLNTFRPQQGMAGILQTMLADAPPELRLNSPVRTIADDGRRVRVTTVAGQTFAASAVVVAVPVNVWKNIRFAPGLSPERLRATHQTIGAPHSKKFWMHIRSDIGRSYAYAPEGYPVDTLVPHRELADGQIMIGFSVHPTLDVSNLAQLQAAVRLIVPDAEVVAARAQDWGRDPYALGGWSFRRPGQLVDLLAQIQRPQGRIAFATADIASGWSGYVDGAIESGLRAASQVAPLVHG
ncbi:FAD-dependent oxidoreductase [Micromonospora sp. NPDC049523]|uniref:flavin monoamine oxidase family protein n=1 Tax=Micromonospora sp. NPDC049523 TaxID=3155921 RepID=UPI0034215C53